MKVRFTPIEDVLNIFDNDRYWLYIPGFNGYEVSNDGYVRSMKHFRKYPCGILIKAVDREPYKSSTDPLYELSDDNNKRQRIRLSQIMHLAATNQYSVRGYPRSTVVTSTSGRNKWVQNENGSYVKVYNGPAVCKKSLAIPPMDNTAKYFPFKIIQDGTEMVGMTYRQPEYTVPIQSIKGDVYYGRDDCRTICGSNVRTGSECIFHSSQQETSNTRSPRWPKNGSAENTLWGI